MIIIRGYGNLIITRGFGSWLISEIPEIPKIVSEVIRRGVTRLASRITQGVTLESDVR